MNHMKRKSLILLALLYMIFAATGCSTKKNSTDPNANGANENNVNSVTNGNEGANNESANKGEGNTNQGNTNQGNQGSTNQGSTNQGNSNSGSNTNQNSSQTNADKYLKDQEEIMKSMTNNMKNITLSGDPGIDFLSGMIPHHESAIAMADSYLKYEGQDTRLKAIAMDMKEDQTEEVDEMNYLIKKLKENPTVDKEKETAYIKEYKMLFDEDMGTHKVQSATSLDEAFGKSMIMHHEMGIKMAESILNYSDHPEIIDLAYDIIEEQKDDIREIKEVIEK